MHFETLNHLWSKSNQTLKKQNNYRVLFPYYNETNDQSIETDFASNDYLGLKNDSRIIEAGYLAAQKNGAGAGASRIVIETDSTLAKLETFFAQETGYSHSLFFPSGFMANLAFFDALSLYAWEEEHISQEIFIDHRSHSSLFFGLKSSNLKYTAFRHNDYEHLAMKLEKSNAKIKIIVVESLYSMDGDFSSKESLALLCDKFNALLFADETHAIGIYGKNGAGFFSEYSPLKKYIVAASFGCGKAIGVQGGFIATNSNEFKQRILQKSRPLIFSTATSPFITGAVQKSLEIIFSEEGQSRRESLFTQSAFFKEKAVLQSTHSSHIFSIIYGDNLSSLLKEKELLKNKILVKAIRPPSVPRNTARLRVIIRSDHNIDDIEKLIRHL